MELKAMLNSIIWGFVPRGNQEEDNEKIKEYFSVIETEVDKTIAVMKGLCSQRRWARTHLLWI